MIQALSVSIRGGNFASLLNREGEFFEDRFGVFPSDTGIRDADAILESVFALFGNFLVA